MSVDPAVFEQTIGQGDSVNFDGYKLLHSYVSGSGSPVGSVTPNFIGQEYFQTTGSNFFKATGLTSSDWKQITA